MKSLSIEQKYLFKESVYLSRDMDFRPFHQPAGGPLVYLASKSPDVSIGTSDV